MKKANKANLITWLILGLMLIVGKKVIKDHFVFFFFFYPTEIFIPGHQKLMIR